MCPDPDVLTATSPAPASRPVVLPRSFAEAGNPAAKKARERRRSLARLARRAAMSLLTLAATFATVLALRPRPVPVDIARAVRGPLMVVIEESGMTRVKDRYIVSAPAAGNLSRLPFEAGDVVKESDVLAEIAPAPSTLLDSRTRSEAEAKLGAALAAEGQAHAQASRAQAAKELSDQEVARFRKLAASGSISSRELDQTEFAARMHDEELSSARFALKVATEEVRMARETLGHDGQGRPSNRHIDVAAPASGRVLRVLQKSAGVVQAGTPLVEVGDPSVLEVVVDLLTTDAVNVKPGTPVMIVGWGGDRSLAGRVRRVEPSAFTRPSALGVDEQRVNVIIAFTDPPADWSVLGDAFRIEARIVSWQSDDVMTAPLGAVFRYGDGWAVFRVEGTKAHLVPVQVGHRGETEIELVSGVSSGDVLVVHPGDRVRDDARVEPR